MSFISLCMRRNSSSSGINASFPICLREVFKTSVNCVFSSLVERLIAPRLEINTGMTSGYSARD